MEEFYFNFQELFAANVVKIIENKIYYAIFGVYTFFFFFFFFFYILPESLSKVFDIPRVTSGRILPLLLNKNNDCL